MMGGSHNNDKYRPLTAGEKDRLDENDNRIWTETEIKCVHHNLQVCDRVQEILNRKCKAPGCGYAISSLDIESFSVPNIGEVCGVCYHMHEALHRTKNILYFRNIQEQWKRDNDPNDPGFNRRGGPRDRLGL